MSEPKLLSSQSATEPQGRADLNEESSDAITNTIDMSWDVSSNAATDVISDATNTDKHDKNDDAAEEDKATDMHTTYETKLSCIRTAMSAREDVIFVVDYKIWPEEPSCHPEYSNNFAVTKTLDGALETVAEFFNRYGVMQEIMQYYSTSQLLPGVSIAFDPVQGWDAADESPVLLAMADLAVGLNNGTINYPFLQIQRNSAGKTFVVKVTRFVVIGV